MTMGIIITVLIVLLGLFTLSMSVSFFLKPTEVKLGLVRPLSVATTYASVVGLTSGLAVALFNMAQALENPQASPAGQFVGGVSEALIPAIIGFSLLTVSWLAISLGMRRHL